MLSAVCTCVDELTKVQVNDSTLLEVKGCKGVSCTDKEKVQGNILRDSQVSCSVWIKGLAARVKRRLSNQDMPQKKKSKKKVHYGMLEKGVEKKKKTQKIEDTVN